MSAPAESATLKRTPLYALHRELGAKLIDFGGWEMPVQYQGILEEHRAVRERAGIFDVSHMGELEMTGGEAMAALQRLTPNEVSKLADGRCHYSAYGFEICVAPEFAEPIFRALLDAGKPEGITPCGLGARDTLRLEAKMALVETPFYKRKKEVPA